MGLLDDIKKALTPPTPSRSKEYRAKGKGKRAAREAAAADIAKGKRVHKDRHFNHRWGIY